MCVLRIRVGGGGGGGKRGTLFVMLGRDSVK